MLDLLASANTPSPMPRNMCGLFHLLYCRRVFRVCARKVVFVDSEEAEGDEEEGELS